MSRTGERAAESVERVDAPIPLELPPECEWCGDEMAEGECVRRCPASRRAADQQRKTWRNG